MSVVVEGKRGKNVILLNPSEKRTKAFTELQDGIKRTNDYHTKVDKNGRPMILTPEERAYRAGYIASQNDSAKCFKAKHPRYKRKTL